MNCQAMKTTVNQATHQQYKVVAVTQGYQEVVVVLSKERNGREPKEKLLSIW